MKIDLSKADWQRVSSERMRELNERLARSPEIDVDMDREMGFTMACRILGGHVGEEVSSGVRMCVIPLYDEDMLERGNLYVRTWVGRGSRTHTASLLYVPNGGGSVVDFGRISIGGKWSTRPLDFRCRREIYRTPGGEKEFVTCWTVDEEGQYVPNGLTIRVLMKDFGDFKGPVAVGVSGNRDAVFSRTGFSKGMVWIYSE